jgi:predicted RNA-binding protein with RPS1 domain
MTKGTFALWCMSIGSVAGFSPGKTLRAFIVAFPSLNSSCLFLSFLSPMMCVISFSIGSPISLSLSLSCIGTEINQCCISMVIYNMNQSINKSLAVNPTSLALKRSSGVGAVNTYQTCSLTGCSCASCTGLNSKTASHTAGCSCSGCVNTRRRTVLFADVADAAEETAVEVSDDVVAAEVTAVEGDDEVQKKKPDKGKSLSEFEEGSTVTGTIKSLASYGAFVDIGATTDGLLHVSQLTTEFVSDPADLVKAGQEVEVRIVKIDAEKGQIALSMISEEDAAAASEAAKKGRGGGGRPQRGGRRDDSAILNALNTKGWDAGLMVEGLVVSTTDFGAFVKVNAALLNAECEGEFDGLVHISALGAGRVNSVSDVVKPNDKVQVRCKSIADNKVSLTMLTVEDEEAKGGGGRGGGGGGGFEFDRGDMGAKDWKESHATVDEEESVHFGNTALMVKR